MYYTTASIALFMRSLLYLFLFLFMKCVFFPSGYFKIFFRLLILSHLIITRFGGVFFMVLVLEVHWASWGNFGCLNFYWVWKIFGVFLQLFCLFSSFWTPSSSNSPWSCPTAHLILFLYLFFFGLYFLDSFFYSFQIVSVVR